MARTVGLSVAISIALWVTVESHEISGPEQFFGGGRLTKGGRPSHHQLRAGEEGCCCSPGAREKEYCYSPGVKEEGHSYSLGAKEKERAVGLRTEATG